MKKIAISVLIGLFVISSMVWASIAGAQDHPTNRLTYIICFNPGGESDITARFQEQPLKKFFSVRILLRRHVPQVRGAFPVDRVVDGPRR